MDIDLMEKFTERALKEVKRGETHHFVFVPAEKGGDHVLIVSSQYAGEELFRKVWDAMKRADEEDDNLKVKSFWGAAHKGSSSRLVLETGDPPSKARIWAKELTAQDSRIRKAGFKKVLVLGAGEDEPPLEPDEDDDDSGR